MNRYFGVLLFVMLAICPSPAQFEGIVETRNLTTDEIGNLQQFTMTMWIKKDRIRVQSSAFGNTPATTMIYRNDRRVVWMLNEEEKTYFEILQEERPPEPGSSLRDKPTIRRSGRTKKILGFSCEQVLLTHPAGETEIWGTKQLADLEATTSRVLGESGSEGGDWMDEVARLGLYPLVSRTRMEGRLVESQETTRIEKKTISADLFDLPPGYRKQTMGEMPGQAHD